MERKRVKRMHRIHLHHAIVRCNSPCIIEGGSPSILSPRLARGPGRSAREETRGATTPVGSRVSRRELCSPRAANGCARSGSFPTTPPEERVRGAGEVDAMTQIQVSESGTLVRHGLCRRHAVVVVVVVLIVIIVVGVVGVHTCSVCARTRAFHACTSSG